MLDPPEQRARRKATGQGTSVNALITEYLTLYAESDPMGDALAAFLDLADRSDGGSGPAHCPVASGSALMMLRLIAMFHDTSRSSCSGRLSAPV